VKLERSRGTWDIPEEMFGNLDGIGSGALAEIIGDDPTGKARRNSIVKTEPPYENLVMPGNSLRMGVQLGFGVVQENNPRLLAEKLSEFRDRDRVKGFNPDSFSMSTESRQTDARCRNWQGG